MAEGLAAIGLAGNIVQFVSFTFVLISKTRELQESASGTLNENVDLNIIAQDIRTFTSLISSNVRSAMRLSDVARRCDAIACELLDAITKLQHKHRQGSGKAPTRWQTFRQALKSVWGKAHIEELMTRLERLRDQVTVHLVSDTNDNQSLLMVSLENWKKENIQTGYEITAQIHELDVQLQATQQNISGFCSDAVLKAFQDNFSRLSSKVHQVSRSYMIVASLRYDCMHIRQSAIKDAHVRTFDWMYNRDIGFTQWLQSGHGIYWITGKPGSGKSTLMKYVYDHGATTQDLGIWCGNAQLVRACFYFWKPGQQMQKSLEGLLQSLLHHILHACPELAPTICPERWNAEYPPQPDSIIPPIPWTLPELQRSIALFRTQSAVTTKFYFQVDGLDEYYGDSWDVIETMRDLSTAPNVKLCLSSRPWNCFQRSFGQANPHALRIHDFTRPDIELFAQETLLRSYSPCVDFESNVFNDLIRDIGERAQGVFLWVRLVVRSLRDGIINEDSISLLHERLRAIPSDLEEFFDQILVSVEGIYRSRMARTFLAAMRTPLQLDLIHYYFLEQEDKIFGFAIPSHRWQAADIQKRAVQTERRLNGRFKGLLEVTSMVNLSAHTKVDFLHRTLSDFLSTKRMREKLDFWALGELNVCTAIGRALIAESKFIDEHSYLSKLKLAVELASQGASETDNTEHCFEVINQAEVENGRTIRRHTSCGLNCDIIRFAASIGHADYLEYRVNKSGPKISLDRILRHTVSRPVNFFDEEYGLLPSTIERHNSSRKPKDPLDPPISQPVGNCVLPSLVKQLLELGADPNAVIDGITTWTAFAGEVTKLMDGEQKEQCWAVLELFLEKGANLNAKTEILLVILDRKDADSEDNLRNTLRYFKCLFGYGLDPNAITWDGTLIKDFLCRLTRKSSSLSSSVFGIYNSLLREFLRAGADVSMIYKDKTRHGWLRSVCRELLGQSTYTLFSICIVQYRIFLEHGLDPNMATDSARTVWESLLDAMSLGIQQGSDDLEYYRAIRDMILISLQYGAEPQVGTVHQILSWMKSNKLSKHSDVVAPIDGALQREIKHRESQEQSRYDHRPRNDGPSKTVTLRSSDVTPRATSRKAQQVEKRRHGQSSDGGRDERPKRLRFS